MAIPEGTNGTNGHASNGHASKAVSDGEGFTLKPEPVENLRPLRVVVVGAGFSGIAAAIR